MILIDSEEIVKKNGGKLYVTGHHQAHASDSPFILQVILENTIAAIDGGGVDNEDEYSIT